MDGLLRQVLIDGPSMAPAFCGVHYDVTCDDCGFSFRCDAEHVPSDGKAVCPNCGFGGIALSDARLLPAQRVVIDRWPLLFRLPRRGEVVALKVPGDSGSFAVKRIAALPGERLAIHGGDLFVNDSIVQKSPEELRLVRVLVHDNHYQPQKTKDLPPRWRRTQTDSRWRSQGDGFRLEALEDAGECDWLEYDHWPCTANPRLRGVACPITDNDSCNQGDLHRPLNVVIDVILSCRLQAAREGRAVLAAVDGDQRFELLILPTAPSVLLLDGKQFLVVPIDLSRFANGAQVEFGLCDEQVFLILDSKTIVCQAYDRRTAMGSEPLHPLAIGSLGAGLQISDLKVWRDIYYLDPHGLSRDWQMERPLGPHEYAVLGDNQPVSIDSRQWEPSAIKRKAILGLVRKQ
jgi:type IV secretory pathway protease TraF